MFTWICPQCGREVPPAYTECPNCAPKAKGEPAAAPQPEPVAAPQSAPPPPTPQPVAPPRSESEPPKAQPYVAPVFSSTPAPPQSSSSHAGLPTWLMTIVFAFAFLGLGAGIYWTVGYFKGAPQKPAANVESPAAKAGAPVNPFQKYMEVSGVRFEEDPKDKTKTIIRFLLTNHSPAEAQGLAGNVTVWGRTQKSEEDAAGTFTFKTDIGPFESKEMKAPLNTKLKIYELPDWQNVSTDVQITAPSGG